MAELPSWASNDIIKFIIFLSLVAAAAFFGGQWGAKDWYRALSKPRWTPPSWLFPPVWTLLYVMIAMAGLVVWNTAHESRGLLLGLWGTQLIVNSLWSYFFFGRRDIALGLVDIMTLWVVIAAFIVTAWPVSRLASVLFMPYLVWVSYATALNASILRRAAERA